MADMKLEEVKMEVEIGQVEGAPVLVALWLV